MQTKLNEQLKSEVRMLKDQFVGIDDSFSLKASRTKTTSLERKVRLMQQETKKLTSVKDEYYSTAEREPAEKTAVLTKKAPAAKMYQTERTAPAKRQEGDQREFARKADRDIIQLEVEKRQVSWGNKKCVDGGRV